MRLCTSTWRGYPLQRSLPGAPGAPRRACIREDGVAQSKLPTGPVNCPASSLWRHNRPALESDTIQSPSAETGEVLERRRTPQHLLGRLDSVRTAGPVTFMAAGRRDISSSDGVPGPLLYRRLASHGDPLKLRWGLQRHGQARTFLMSSNGRVWRVGVGISLI